MQSLWLENQQLAFRDIPVPEPSDEALIRIRLAGICGTDLELLKGYYPFRGVPGHEFVGEVVQSSDPEWIGKRVVGEINITCGKCEPCLRGRSAHCENRIVLGISGRDGVHAEFVRLPLANLHRVPDVVPDEAAVFTEPLAAALEIQEQVHFSPSSRVLLIGAGRLGQLIAQTLALNGCSLRVAVRYPHQKQLLESRGIRTISEGEIPVKGYDVVIEATGSPSGFDLARRSIRARGTLVLKSTYRDPMLVRWSPMVVDEITLIGSRCGPFPPALHLLSTRSVDPTPLIDQIYPLARGIKAFEEAQKGGSLKILLQP